MCGDGLAIVSDIGKRISTDGGCALLIDYGLDGPSGDSIRGIRGHTFQHILQCPGEVDISALVDFKAVKSAGAIDGVAAAGSVGQGEFLRELGIEARLATLLAGVTSETQAQELVDSAERLVSDEHMGRSYRAWALVGKDMLPVAGFL